MTVGPISLEPGSWTIFGPMVSCESALFKPVAPAEPAVELLAEADGCIADGGAPPELAAVTLTTMKRDNPTTTIEVSL